MPESFDYLLLGGGTSCGYAAAAIREIDKESSIGILSADGEPPYDRPPFSKNFLIKDAMEVSDAHSKEENFYKDNDISLLLGVEAYSIKAGPRAIELRSGELVHYRRLLYALGSEPRRLDIPGAENAMTLRTAEDSAKIKGAANEGTAVCIIGGGYIGVEVAASLAQRGAKVTLVERGPHLLSSLHFPELSGAVLEELQRLGVRVILNGAIRGIHPKSVEIEGETIPAELILMAVGAAPRLKMAEDIGLLLGESGILADASLRSSDPNIWLAGDVVEYPDPIIGRNFRAEHHLHAKWSGAHAGKSMAGEASEYRKVPYFFSDVGELSIIFRGDPDPKGKSYVSRNGEAITRIELYPDGRLASFTDVRRDYKAQDPITDAAEKLIESGFNASTMESELASGSFDAARLVEWSNSAAGA